MDVHKKKNFKKITHDFFFNVGIFPPINDSKPYTHYLETFMLLHASHK